MMRSLQALDPRSGVWLSAKQLERLGDIDSLKIRWDGYGKNATCIVENKFTRAVEIRRTAQVNPDHRSELLPHPKFLQKGDRVVHMMIGGHTSTETIVQNYPFRGVLQRSNRKVAISALESLVKYSTDVQQILTCFRCLTRLRLTLSGESPDPLMEANAVATYLESVLVQLNGIAVKEPMSASEKDMLTNEASWFMKVAWNMAIEHSTVSRLTHLFFAKCSQFCELLSNDTSNLGRQKTCLVMAAAASLQMAREAQEDDEKRTSLEKVLEHVYSCQNVCSQLHDGVGSGDGEKRDRAYSMLLLYEIEALAKLGRSSELEGLVKQVLSSPSYDTKTIETLAVLVMEPPANYKQLSKKLLHAAIDKHMNSNDIDIETCSKTLHSAIRLCLGEGGGSESTGREEAWHLYQLAVKLLQSEKKDSYPEMEILWLMTKAWNTGIYSFSSGQYSLADVWCTMGMDLMTHLTALKVNYEEKMKSLFAEIQAKISSLKLKDSLEE